MTQRVELGTTVTFVSYLSFRCWFWQVAHWHGKVFITAFGKLHCIAQDRPSRVGVPGLLPNPTPHILSLHMKKTKEELSDTVHSLYFLFAIFRMNAEQFLQWVKSVLEADQSIFCSFLKRQCCLRRLMSDFVSVGFCCSPTSRQDMVLHRALSAPRELRSLDTLTSLTVASSSLGNCSY